MRNRTRLGVVVIVLSVAALAWSADKDSPAAPGGGKADARPAAGAPGRKAAEFKEGLAQLKSLLGDLLQLRTEYKSAEPARRGEIRRRYDQVVAKAEALEAQLLEAAEKAYLESPNTDAELADFLVAMALKQKMEENYEESLRLAKLLIDNRATEKHLYNVAAIDAFIVGQLDTAEQYFKAAKENDVLTADAEQHLQDLPYYKEAWSKEARTRAAEAKADDLPRVLLKTTKGDIELELFENEAPIAVANFISLVRKKYYDGLTFHRVLPMFMAQGGCPKGDGTGGPGYTIPCECYEPNHRLHFRGSLSMAHAGRDTGGSQFFLTFVPQRGLDGRHTVFGRVVKGMEVLGKIQRRDPSKANPPEPDRILEAKVLRAREHPYEPKKIAE